MIAKLLTLGLILLWAITPVTAKSLLEYQYKKPLVNISKSNHDLATVMIDNELYELLGDLQKDLRVIDSELNELPFVVKKVETTESNFTTTYKPLKRTIISFQELENNGYIVVQNDSKEPIEHIEIITSKKNFDKKISVYGSNSAEKDYQLIVADVPFCDYTSKINLRKTAFDISTNYKYIKLIISNFQETQVGDSQTVVKSNDNEQVTRVLHNNTLQISDIIISQKIIKEEKSSPTPALKKQNVNNLIITENDKDKTTILTFKTQHQFINKLIIQSSTKNFMRYVDILAKNPSDEAYIYLSSNRQISQTKYQQINESHGEITLPVNRYSQYKIIIHNNDDMPLQNLTVDLLQEQHQIIFMDSPLEKTVYTCLNYKTPKYNDLNHLLNNINSNFEYNQYKLLPKITNTDFKKPPTSVNYSHVLVIVVLLVLIVLGVVVVKSFKKINEMEDK